MLTLFAEIRFADPSLREFYKLSSERVKKNTKLYINFSIYFLSLFVHCGYSYAFKGSFPKHQCWCIFLFGIRTLRYTWVPNLQIAAAWIISHISSVHLACKSVPFNIWQQVFFENLIWFIWCKNSPLKFDEIYLEEEFLLKIWCNSLGRKAFIVIWCIILAEKFSLEIWCNLFRRQVFIGKLV